MDDLHWRSAFELAAMIRRRELKPSELMTATIARIEQLNPRLNAFCATRFDEALAEARRLDERRGRGDADHSPAGLPLARLPLGAERHRDDLVPQATHAFELARPWNDHWPKL